MYALALASVRRHQGAAAGETSAGEESDADAAAESAAALELLSGLSTPERQALRVLSEQLSKLPAPQLDRWLRQRLAAARGVEIEAVLDEHIHPSHIAEALRVEARSVRLLILRWLPSPPAAQAAELLGLALPRGRDANPAPDPAPEVIRVLHRAFLARFVSAAELPAPTILDRLSGAELRRLVKFMGAREIAFACRRLPVEDVALFLRRFPPEDTRMTAQFIEPQPRLEPRRAAFAERLVEEAVSMEVAPEAMLNHIGLKLLAMAISEGGTARLRFTAQKIPFEAASVLSELVNGIRGAFDAEALRLVAAEAEALAAGLYRPTASG